MTERLGSIDWHLLDCERGELGRDGLPFAEAVLAHVRPMWSSLLNLGETRYRISSKMADAEIAWGKIEAALFPKHHDIAAE